MTDSELGVGELIHNGVLYDRLNQFDDDIPFYLELSKRAEGRVLELCCGTGRITITLSQQGIDITGLDFTESMLQRAREKATGLPLSFVKGDMRSFAIEESFKLIFIPFNSLQNTYTLEDLEGIFTCIKKHLSPGGIFAFDVFNPKVDIFE